MKKQFFIIYSILVVSFILFGCGKKETPICFQEQGVRDCNELFDSIQANLINPERVAELQQCVKENCN